MVSGNMQRFDEYAGLVLQHLHHHFPTPVTVDAGLIGIDTNTGYIKPLDGGMATYTERSISKEEGFFVDTVQWLIAEGYIRAQGNKWCLREAVLTSKGLEALNAIPACLNGSPSLGE